MIFKLITGVIIAAAAWIGIFLVGPKPQPVQQTMPTVGSFSPSGGGTYRMAQSIGTADTSFKLSSFKEPVSNIPYTMSYLGSDIGYGTISPQSSISEFVSFSGITQNSDGSATLTGVSRGISRTPGSGGCVASTTLAQSHAGQSIFILSNQPCFYSEYFPLRTTATSSAVAVFGSTTPPRYDSPGSQASGSYISTTSEFASVAYVNAISIAGVSNATAAVKGIVQLATAAQAALGTALGSTGASLFLGANIATSTPGAQVTNVVPVTGTNQKLAQAFLDLTQAFTFSGGLTSSGATNIAASTGNLLTLNTLTYKFPTTRGAASTTLIEDGSGNLTFQNASYTLLLSTTTANAMTYATTTFSAYNNLYIRVFVPSSVSYGLCANFNSDFGTTYASSYTLIDGLGALRAVQTNSATSLLLGNVTASTTDQFTTMWINNPTAKRKIINFNVTSSDSGAHAPAQYTGGALWNNTSAQITSFILDGGAAGCNNGTFPAGTIIAIYGAN